MKRVYAAPMLAANGRVTCETLCGGAKQFTEDCLYKPSSAGDIGFYL
jgi:hypothetical protein